MSEEHDAAMPYYFCSQCLRLSPTSGDLLEEIICLVCGATLESQSAGRKVVLSKDEAALRDLPWRTH